MSQFQTPAYTPTPLWIRGEATIDGEWIVLDPARAETYPAPSDQPSLLFDLAVLQQPQDALEFVRKYGLLRHGPDAKEFREPFSDWLDVAKTLNADLVLAYILSAALKGDPASCQALWNLETLWRQMYDFESVAITDVDLFSQATAILARRVTEGLQGVQERLEAGVIDEEDVKLSVFSFSVHAPDLIGYAYHQFALLLTEGGQIAGICKACHRFFQLADVRQQYCSPTCAARTRYQRFAQKKRAQSSI
jgi:hypothetical protein